MIGGIIHSMQIQNTHFRNIDFRFIPKSKNLEAHNISKETIREENEAYLNERRSMQEVRTSIVGGEQNLIENDGSGNRGMRKGRQILKSCFENC